MCIVSVKYCNHLFAVDMTGVACRGLWCACGWKNVKRYRDGSTVVSFVPTLFGCFLGIPSLDAFSFFFFFCQLFLGGGGGWRYRAIDPQYVCIMEYGSTPYIGTAPKKMAAPLDVCKVICSKLCPRLSHKLIWTIPVILECFQP